TDRFLIAWLFVSWVLFSISRAKRDLYMLPIHPAAALLVARLFRDAADSPARLAHPSMRWPRRIFAAASVAVGAAIVLVVVLILADADRAILSGATGRLAKWAESWNVLR